MHSRCGPPGRRGGPLTTFRWLHLTDLHQGQRDDAVLFPEVEEALFADLASLHRDLGGPIDVVVFSGDLTQRGAPAEFDALNRRLDRLWARLRELGSEPVLVAAPGNHDLVRPPPMSAAARVLALPDVPDDVWQDFWSSPESDYRQVVAKAFAPYVTWLATHPFPRPAWQPGLLPGEAFATIEKGPDKLGIVVLNTAFRQLTGDDFSGRLVLDRRQYLAAPGGDANGWIEAHSAALLVTHHPPGWLDGPSRDVLGGVMRANGRFALHLSGHLHEAVPQLAGFGDIHTQHGWQSASLFGMEGWGSSRQRIHGYTAGALRIEGDKGKIRLWPRIGVAPRAPLPWRVVPDLQGSVALSLADHGTEPIHVRTRGRSPTPAHPHAETRPTATLPRADRRTSRRDLERKARARLESPGAPLILWGPEGFGKTWLLWRVLSDAAGDLRSHVARLDVSGLDAESRRDAHRFYRQLAGRVVDVLDDARRAQFEQRWRENDDLPPGDRLRSCLHRAALDENEKLVLAIDHIDELDGGRRAPGAPERLRDDVLRKLRSWAGDNHPRWQGFRVAITANRPVSVWSDADGSPINLSLGLELTGLEPEQAIALAHRHELDWSDEACARIVAWTGGSPARLQRAIEAAKWEGASADHLATDTAPYAQWLGGIDAWVADRGFEGAIAALARTDGAVLLDNDEVACDLYAVGIVELVPSGGRIHARLRSPLVRSHFAGASVSSAP